MDNVSWITYMGVISVVVWWLCSKCKYEDLAWTRVLISWAKLGFGQKLSSEAHLSEPYNCGKHQPAFTRQFFFLGDILNLKSYTSISQKLTLITREEDDSTFKNTICVLDVVAEITETTSNL